MQLPRSLMNFSLVGTLVIEYSFDTFFAVNGESLRKQKKTQDLSDSH